jgi:nitric oxide reductase NorQ protein
MKDRQYLLRVRRGGELDKVMDCMLENGSYMTESQLQTAGGKKRSAQLARYMAQFFDNYTTVGGPAKGTKLAYADPVPSVPVSVSVSTTTQNIQSDSSLAVEQILWPEMPAVPESIGEVFREPSWFKPMERMVELGHHIAIAGPPAVGKDTGIIELAAKYGMPLVMVGGEGGLRKRDLVGTTEIVNGSTSFHVAEFAAAVVYGWWASITEINAADPDVIILLNAVMASPYIINIQGKAYPVHPNFRLFVSYNPGLAGTKPLNAAFKDRFFSITVPFFTTSQMKSILEAHGAISDSRLDAVIEYGRMVYVAYERGQMRYQITARRLMDAVVLYQNGIADSVKQSLEMAVVAAIDSQVEVKAASNILDTLFGK